MLQEAAQGTCAVDGVVGAVDDKLLGLFGQLHGELLVGQTAVEAGEQQVDDVGDVVLGQGLVEDDLVQTVEELGAEGALEQLIHLLPGLLGDLSVLADAIQQELAAQVGGEDDDGVLKVHGASLAVGDPAVVQDLQQHVEHVGVGLLHLVKEDDGVGLAAHRLGELAALLVAHISGRGTDQAGDGEFLHVFAHVDAHQILFAVKQGLGQGFGQLGLAHAGGTQEQEGADGLVGVGDAGAAAEDGLGHQTHRLVLTHHPLVEDLLQMEQLFPFALHQAGDGDAGPALDDAGDLLLGDLVPQQGALTALRGDLLFGLQRLAQLRDAAVLQLSGLLQVVLPLSLLQLCAGLLQLLAQLLHLADGVFLVVPLGLLGGELLPHVGQLLLDLGQMLPGDGVLLLFQGGLLDLVLDDPALDHVQLGGHGVDLGADHGAGLVHQVDGLVGEEAVGDIAVGEGGGGDDGTVGDLHAVVDLVALLQAAEDGHSVLHGGLVDQNGLEAALQSGILFDILAVLVEGGGTNAVQLTAGQHGLEQVAGIHAALGLAGTHDGVQLVDEEDDAAVGLAHLVEDGLQTLLELAPVLGTCDQRAHVQREDGLVLQGVGYVPLDDALGQTLGDGGLAHAGFTDEDGVVFALAAEDADDVADLVVAADDGVQLVLAGAVHQIGAVLLQRVVGLLGVVAGDPLVAPDGSQSLHHLFPGNVVGAEQLFQGCVGAVQQAQEQMLHRDILVFHGVGHRLGGADGLVHILGDIDLVGLTTAAGDLGQLVHLCLNGGLEGGEGHAHGGEQLGHQTLAVGEEGQQQVGLLDLLVAVGLGQRLGALHGGQRLLGKLIHIHREETSFAVVRFRSCDVSTRYN